jgi:hypothetical protein
MVIVNTGNPQRMTQRLLARRMGLGAANSSRLWIQECSEFEIQARLKKKNVWPSLMLSQKLGFGKKERGWTRPLV